MVRPPVEDLHADESVLVEYLAEARRIFASAAEWAVGGPAPTGLSPEFEHLRWFELPAASLPI